MWYEILFRVLSIINYVVLIIIAIPLLLQVFYILLFFVKKKTFPKSDKKAKIAYVIPAHNEESVIYDVVKNLLGKQNYPKENYDVYVIAHNCTDKTAEFAEKAGAKVLVLDDPDPSHRKALYPLKYGIDYLINLPEGSYDLVIHLDADNYVNKEFSSLMNDAYQSGIDFACPYEGSLNGTQNYYTKASALIYAFNSRFGGRVRERLGISAHINGSGATFSMKMLKECGGYDCVTVSDDAEFNFNRLLEGYKGHFVEEAVVYEDMPSTFKDTMNRNKRIGSGSMGLLKAKMPLLFKKFFKTWDFSLMEMFLLYEMNFLGIFLGIWLPIYYAYHFTFTALVQNGTIAVTMMPVSYYSSMLWTTLIVAACVLLGLFFIFGFLQAAIVAVTDYKKLGARKRRELFTAVLLFPFSIILYGVTICIGGMSKPSWGKVKRNTVKSNDEFSG